MAGFLDTSWIYRHGDFRDKFLKYSIKFGTYFLFIVYFVFLFNYISSDKESLTNTNTALYMTGILLPLVVFSYFIFSGIDDKKYLGLVVFAILIMLIMLLRSFLPSFNDVLKNFGYSLASFVSIPPLSDEYSYLIIIVTKLLLLMMAFVALSIMYNVFLNETYRQEGKLGFIIYLVFYIPCMISDYLKYLFVELKTTPQVVYALVFLEIALILLYIYIPKLFAKIIVQKKHRILYGPSFFNHKKVISNTEPFYDKSGDLNGIVDESMYADTNKRIRRNYALSMWITTNEPNIGRDEEVLMFRFGEDLGTLTKPDQPKNGCPYIACMSDGRWKFVLSNSVHTILKCDYEEITSISDDDLKEVFDWSRYKYEYNIAATDLAGAWGHFVDNKSVGGVFDDNDVDINKYLIDENKFWTNNRNNNFYDVSENPLDINEYMTREEIYDVWTDVSGEKYSDKKMTLHKKYRAYKLIDFDSNSCKTVSVIPTSASNVSYVRNGKNLKGTDTEVSEIYLKQVTTILKVPMQRWNNVVLNYKDNDVDIFINGELVETIPLAKNELSYLPQYNISQSICIGSDQKKIHGAICNVNVYQNNLNQTQIAQMYNILKTQNPPVNNLF